MYRAYLKYLKEEGIDVAAEASSEHTVVKCWEKIEEECANFNTNKGTHFSASKLKSRIVRVFVSSTFTDFHNERENLVKKVCNFISVKFLCLK